MNKVYLLILGLLFNFLCSQKRSLQVNLLLKKELDSVCLSSLGKGRVRFKGSRKLFSYESYLNNKDENWKVALRLPIIGEKLMSISWGESEGGRIRMKGSFIGALFKELKKDRANKKDVSELKNALQNFSHTISFLGKATSGNLEGCQFFDGKARCQVPQKSVEFELEKDFDKLVLTPILNNKKTYKVVASNISDKYYSRLSVLPIDAGSYSDSIPFSLDLFIKSCSL